MPGLKRHQTRLRSSVSQQGNADASTASAPGSRPAPPAASTSRQPAPPRQQQRLASETPSTSHLGGSIDRGGSPAVGGPPFANEGEGGAFGAMAADEARDAYGEGNEEEEDGLGLSHKIVLCITSWNTKIGCCYYHPAERKLYLIEDAIDSSKFDLAMNIIEQVQPHLTLVSNRADPALIDAIKATLGRSTAEYVPTVEIRPAREFVSGQGRSSLLTLPLFSGELQTDEDVGLDGRAPQHGDDADDEIVHVGQEQLTAAQQFMRLRYKRIRTPASAFVSALRLGSSLAQGTDKTLETVACLFSYVRRNMIQENGPDDPTLDVVSIEMLPLAKTMLINSSALSSLQIFAKDSHANMHSSDKPDGLSLHNMLNLAKTQTGKSLMKRWMLQPSLDIAVLNARYDAVECFSHEDNLHTARTLSKALKKNKNIPKVLSELVAGLCTVTQWTAVSGFIDSCMTIRDLLSSLVGGSDVEVLKKFSETYEQGLFEDLRQMIDEKVDWAESALQHRMCVQDGVDERLDENRRAYRGLPSMLSRVAEHLTKNIDRAFTTALNVVYFPQLGYLCAVPLPQGEDAFADERLEATPHGWLYQFTTEVSIYYKNQEMHDLDIHLGDVHGYIVDREVELVQDMLLKVLDVQEVLCQCADSLAELDVLLAFAEAGRQFATTNGAWTRPVMTPSNVIRIEGGRHPMVEMNVDLFVPNDAQMVGGRGISVQRLREIENKPDMRAIKAAEQAARKRAALRGEVYEGENNDMQPDQDEEEEHLLSPDDSVAVLTGANGSGKSVFLKMVAIIVYMAHIGCFVPAEKAIIGLTDKIMTRVSTKETISRASSAFMIDLNDISFMLRNATSRSLLLVDEFGKGTTTANGAGLFVGLLKYLITRGKDLPKVLLATHFHEIFMTGLVGRGLPAGLGHMELIVDTGKQTGGSTQGGIAINERVTGVTPLFRLSPGLCLKSYAFQCAESYGIPQEVVDRAVEVTDALSRFALHEIMDPQLSEKDEAELKEAELVTRRLIEMDWNDEMDDEEDTCAMAKLAYVLGEKWEPEREVIVRGHMG